MLTADQQIEFVDKAYAAAPHALTPAILKKIKDTRLDDDQMYIKWCQHCEVELEPMEPLDWQ